MMTGPKVLDVMSISVMTGITVLNVMWQKYGD